VTVHNAEGAELQISSKLDNPIASRNGKNSLISFLRGLHIEDRGTAFRKEEPLAGNDLLWGLEVVDIIDDNAGLTITGRGLVLPNDRKSKRLSRWREGIDDSKEVSPADKSPVFRGRPARRGSLVEASIRSKKEQTLSDQKRFSRPQLPRRRSSVEFEPDSADDCGEEKVSGRRFSNSEKSCPQIPEWPKVFDNHCRSQPRLPRRRSSVDFDPSSLDDDTYHSDSEHEFECRAMLAHGLATERRSHSLSPTSSATRLHMPIRLPSVDEQEA